MPAIIYSAPEVLHWLDQGGKASREAGKKKAAEAAKTQFASPAGLVDSIKKAAMAAKDFGKGAWADFAHKRLEDTQYVLDEAGMDIPGPTGPKRITYASIQEVTLEEDDRIVLTFQGGAHVIKPIAHLVAGAIRVPIGWKRGGMEVPYAMLAEEIAARSGVALGPK